MKIFVVHSGSDRDAVLTQVVDMLEKLECRAKVLVLENGGVFWKKEAKKMIKQAQMVLFVVGKTFLQKRQYRLGIGAGHTMP